MRTEHGSQVSESGLYTLADGSCRVPGDASIEAINAHFAIDLAEEGIETIGGLVAHRNGRVPRRGEIVDVGPLRFSVMLTRGGAVRWFRVARLPSPQSSADGGDVRGCLVDIRAGVIGGGGLL